MAAHNTSSLAKIVFSILFIAMIVVLYFYFQGGIMLPGLVNTTPRSRYVWDWLRDPSLHPDWVVNAGERCDNAPFLIPTSGFIGFIWDDSFYPGHRHQGIDTFGGQEVGIAPVYAAYSGYLTRQEDWKASLIIRIPQDPLVPGRQIWIYYTHMADASGEESFISPDYPPGTHEVYVEAGTLLGYQGNYSGNAYNPVGVHLHFSIVRDNGQGSFLNELKIQNTYDPSPYLGLPLNAHTNKSQVPMCGQ